MKCQRCNGTGKLSGRFAKAHGPRGDFTRLCIPCDGTGDQAGGATFKPQHLGDLPHGVGCPGCREARRCNECGEPFPKDGRPLAHHRCVSGRCYPKCCQRVCTHPVGPGRL